MRLIIPWLILALSFLTAPRSSPPPSEAFAAAEWHLTLPAAIKAKLDRSEVVQCVMIGAQPIPVGGIEPASVATEPTANGDSSLAPASPR